MVGIPNEAGGAQPDDVLVAVIDFRSAIIVGVEGMRLGMTVDERLRMIAVDLVQMLGRQGRGEHQPRPQGEGDDQTARPNRHTGIMHGTNGSRGRQMRMAPDDAIEGLSTEPPASLGFVRG